MDLIFHDREFEREVRKKLNVFDRAITDEDALLVDELDLTLVCVKDEDVSTLLCFRNIKSLALEIGNSNSSFLSGFTNLEELLLITLEYSIDFSIFSNMKYLKCLTISGGDYSNMALKNLDALLPLKNLHSLEIHEFGFVDLAPLGKMKQLKSLAVRYSHEVENIDIIGTMKQLESLILADVAVQNLDFLDGLPDCVFIEMCGVVIQETKIVDVSKLKRFKNRDICEIELGGPWEYLDLSELNN